VKVVGRLILLFYSYGLNSKNSQYARDKNISKLPQEGAQEKIGINILKA
jgi:hypothetical protein